MNYNEMLEAAKPVIGPYCKVCPVCNGRACGNSVPGPGSKMPGNVAAKNFDAWQKVCVNMDTLCSNETPDISLSLYGKDFAVPVFIAPIGALKMHYGVIYDDHTYNELIIKTARECGGAAFTGDGVDSTIVEKATAAMHLADGVGVPTIKPWDIDTVKGKLDLVKQANTFAVAMDVDAAGLPFLKKLNANAGSKSVSELREIIAYAERPFIVKGIMTVRGAEKAVEAGAAGIVVSNHGGRVLGQTRASADVLPEIAEAVGGKVKIFVDGGIRSGVDIFKAIALGADAVLIGRPFIPAIYGAGAEGIAILYNKYAAELSDTMAMCGAHTLSEITRDMVYIEK